MCRSIFRKYKATIAILLALAVFLAWARPNSGFYQEEKRTDIDALMKKWEKDVREQMEKTASLKALAAKFPLVLLHSRALYDGGGSTCGWDTILSLETSDPSKTRGPSHLLFHNGGNPCNFSFNLTLHDQNLLVDLGKSDFAKDPGPVEDFY